MVHYYLYIVNNKKVIRLADSNSKTELREKGLQKIGEKIKNYDGLYLYRVSIKPVSKAELKADADPMNKIKTIGGPVVASIERIKINIGPSGSVTLKAESGEGKIYFSNGYFIKNKITNGIPEDSTINNMLWDWVQKKFNTGLFAINIIN